VGILTIVIKLASVFLHNIDGKCRKKKFSWCSFLVIFTQAMVTTWDECRFWYHQKWTRKQTRCL